MKRILILTNNFDGFVSFRSEVAQKLLETHEVYISAPPGGYGESVLEGMGCKIIRTEFSRRGMNPVEDMKLFKKYTDLLKSIKPDVVLTYTVKPNVYGGIACSLSGVSYIANVTGLGTAIENKGPLSTLTVALYKLGLKKASTVFFQNSQNKDFMEKSGVTAKNMLLLPGSGVNLKKHSPEPYPEAQEKTVFLSVGRIMKDKGSLELLEAAQRIKKSYPNTVFRFVGGFDEDLAGVFKRAERKGIVELCGRHSDVHPFYRDCHAVIHPSYHEGMSNVLLEAAATGRPVIASDVPGCRETFEDGVSGISVKAKSAESLEKGIESFMKLSNEKRAEMGKNGRKRAESFFDRERVVKMYIDAVKRAEE